jgi:hypothetical protein
MTAVLAGLNPPDMKSKKLILIVLLIHASFISCKDKFVDNSDNLCVQNIAKNPKLDILPVDTIAAIKALFEVNRMDERNFHVL